MSVLLIGRLLVGPGVAHAIALVDEKELGRRFALEAAGQLPTIDDPAVVTLVRGVGDKLVAGLGPQPFDYRFQVVAHPSLNAFAVPGGYIWFFGGLIAQASDVDELASVMGHEVAHVHAHHIVRQQQQTQLWNYASLLGILLAAVNPVLGAGAMAAGQAASLKYSREFEQEADFLGLRFMRAAGYEPTAMPSFFRKILGTQRLNPSSVPPYLLTHPLTEDRIASVEAQLAAVGRGKRSGKPAADRDLEEARAAILAGGESPEHIVNQYQRRVEATPTDGFAHYLLGVVYATVGRLDAALTAFARARELGGAGERLGYRLAYVHLRQRRTEVARVELERYVAAHPEDPFGQELYGRTLLETNETTRAIDALEAGLARDPNLPESHQLLGRAYGQKGRRGDAYYHLARALELRGKHVEAFTQYMNAREALGPKDPRRPEIETALTDLAEVSPEARRRRAGR